MKLWEYLQEHMLRFPDQTVGEGAASMTYEELVVFARSFARHLRGETRCAIYCRSEMAAAMALLACFAAGVTAVPLPARYGAVYCRKLLKKATPGCVIMDQADRLTVYSVEKAGGETLPEPPALLLCTSGTTGEPKAIRLSEANVVANVRDIAAYFDVGRQDSLLIARPLYHGAVLVGEFLLSLVKGVRVVFDSAPFNPRGLLTKLQSEHITTLCQTPTLATMMTRFLQPGESPPLRNLVLSGECMSAAVGRRLRRAFPKARIYHVYGLTEAGPRVSFLPPEHFDEAPDRVGIPLASVRLQIRDRRGTPVPVGRVGELWVKSPAVMQGYDGDPELTARTLRDGWLRTGDLASLDERGWLKIHGRRDDLILRAGMNIYPQEIEAALKKDPRTREVLAYGQKTKSGVRLALKIAGDFQNVDEVKALCVKCLPPFQVPAAIELLDALPKTAFGKVRRTT